MRKTTDRAIREKLVVSGAGSLSDAELLAIVIREGTETLSAIELAEKILADFGPTNAGSLGAGATGRAGSTRVSAGPSGLSIVSRASGSADGALSAFASTSVGSANTGTLSELASAGVARIRRAAGCGTMRAVSIAAACELARRITAEKSSYVNKITSKQDVAVMFAPLAELPHEEFWALYLTSGGGVIDRACLSRGGVAGTVVDYKLVVKRAVELLASSLIVVHNHPSGVALPSREDESITENISMAAALFEISVVDHIIVSKSGIYSFAENGMMPVRKSSDSKPPAPAQAPAPFV